MRSLAILRMMLALFQKAIWTWSRLQGFSFQGKVVLPTAAGKSSSPTEARKRRRLLGVEVQEVGVAEKVTSPKTKLIGGI